MEIQPKVKIPKSRFSLGHFHLNETFPLNYGQTDKYGKYKVMCFTKQTFVFKFSFSTFRKLWVLPETPDHKELTVESNDFLNRFEHLFPVNILNISSTQHSTYFPWFYLKCGWKAVLTYRAFHILSLQLAFFSSKNSTNNYLSASLSDLIPTNQHEFFLSFSNLLTF